MDKLSKFAENMKKNPLTAAFAVQIHVLKERYGQEYIGVAEDILELFELLGLDAVKTSRKYVLDYLRQMDYFLKNRDYGHSDFEAIREEIYDNETTMMDTYMPGLLLAYAYTTIIYEKNHLFLSEFLPHIDPYMTGIEVGFGEGFYLWETLKKYPAIKLTGYDISPYAVKFASRLLRVAGLGCTRCELEHANILEGIPLENGMVDFAIFAEIIEHIPDPEKGIREMTRILRPGGIIYLTTVMNSNHMDHISNFSSVDEVRKMITNEGLEIRAEKIYHMHDDFPSSKDISTGMAFVAERR